MTTSTHNRPRTAGRQLCLLMLSLLLGGSVFVLAPQTSATAATPAIRLGTSESFAVLAGSGITNTGPTSITGDVGSSPTPSVTGFDQVTLDGVNHEGDAVTQKAKDDLTTAYNQAAASGPPTEVVTELGGTTLTPGVYRSDTLGITGTLTLNTLGDPYAVFVFQAATTLTTATDSAVVVLGGGEACNVFWQIGSSATLGTRSHLVGSVLAATSITATTSATVQGRLLASTGAVTLDSNTLTRATCSTPPTTTPTTTVPTTTPTTTVPTTTPSTTAPTTTPTTGEAAGEAIAPPTGGTTGRAAGGPSAAPPTASPSSGPPTAAPFGPALPDGGGGSGPGTPAISTPQVPAPPTNVPPGSGAPRLPYTGVNAMGLAVVGLALLGIGTGCRVMAGRRDVALGV